MSKDEDRFEKGLRELCNAVHAHTLAAKPTLSDEERRVLRQRIEADFRSNPRREWPNFAAFKADLRPLLSNILAQTDVKLDDSQNELLLSNVLLAIAASGTEDAALAAYAGNLIDGKILNVNECAELVAKVQLPMAVVSVTSWNDRIENVAAVLKAFSFDEKASKTRAHLVTHHMSAIIQGKKSD